MTEELQLELVRKYPKILKNFRGDPRLTCMAWGLECGDGWYNLLDKAMEKIQYLCDLFSANDTEVQLTANQIKEKFGTLRFYASMVGANSTESSIIDDIISEAERRSEYVCEETGKEGSLCKKGGWMKTLTYQKARELGYTAYNEELEKYWKTKDSENATNH